jgi:N-acetylmuramoyl-L-alanine amidase
MPRRPSILLLLAVFVTGLPTARAAEVRNVRLWAAPDNTRVVLDLSARTRNTVTTLHNPERVVIDLPGSKIAAGARALPRGSGPVRSLSAGHSPSGGLRLVLNLARPIKPKSFIAAPNAQYGYRLVLDLPAPAGINAGSSSSAPAAAVRAEHGPREARDLVIAVDAGHGGEDPGAIGKNGTREKDVTLAIARDLAARLNGENGMHAVLTRGGDYFVELRDRMRRARAQQADMFVSVHADSVADRSIDGSSVYILSPRGATDEASRWLAERENAADLIGGVSLDNKSDVLASVLLDLSQSASLNASQDAADRVLRELGHAGQVRKRQVQQARFVVLKSPDIPSMLVETAYISNPQEEQRLRTQLQQGRIAAAIQQGVHDYFYANPPAGTRVAQLATGAPSGAPVRAVLATAGAAEGAGN